MAQQAPLSFSSFLVSNTPKILRIVLLQTSLAATAAAQTPQQQYVFGSVAITTTTSQVAAYAKNGQTGVLSAVAGSPFANSLQGGAMAIDGLGRFLFVLNTSTSNVSMFQIDQSTGSLTEVPGSPFSTGPTENPNMAATSPVCLAAEKSGQFLYVGYRFGNFVDQGAINEYLIDAANRQLVPLSGQPTTDIASAPIGMIADPKGLHLYVGLGLNPSTGVEDAGTSVYSIDPVSGVLGLVGTAGNAISGGEASPSIRRAVSFSMGGAQLWERLTARSSRRPTAPRSPESPALPPQTKFPRPCWWIAAASFSTWSKAPRRWFTSSTRRPARSPFLRPL